MVFIRIFSEHLISADKNLEIKIDSCVQTKPSVFHHVMPCVDTLPWSKIRSPEKILTAILLNCKEATVPHYLLMITDQLTIAV